MKIIISPFSSKLRSGKNNAKNYPVSYWKEVIWRLKLYNQVIQIGVGDEEILTHDFRFNLKLSDLKELIDNSDLFISVDNFFPHFCHYYKKKGIVIFSKSDPLIFGYKENINLLKDIKYLRAHQFQTWDECNYDNDAFVEPQVVIDAVSDFQRNHCITHEVIAEKIA